MLVCHCLRVFDRTIRECLRSGARTCDEVSERCGAASGCGGCRASVEAIVQSELGAEDEPANDRSARVAA